jgi:hypothetical protein
MFVTIVATLAMLPQHKHHMMRGHKPAKMAKPVDESPAIKAGFMDVKHAFETKNWSLFRSRCTSNFQQELPNGQVLTLRQSVANLQKTLGPLTDIKVDMNLQQIKVDGNMAVVDDRFMMKAKMKDKKGSHNVRAEGSETVSTKKVGGRWVAYHEKMHDQSMSVDGHVVMHMP